jgi:hypothetical protein
MRKIENFTATAPKLSSGNLEYCLWVDDQGALYVQIIKNLTETVSPGSHSKLLFKVSTYFDLRFSDAALDDLQGINPSDYSVTIDGNNDAGAFVKAILRHLFPK